MLPEPEELGQGVDGMDRHAGALKEVLGAKLFAEPGVLPAGAGVHAQDGGAQRPALGVDGHHGLALHGEAQGSDVAGSGGSNCLADGLLGQPPYMLGVLFGPVGMGDIDSILPAGAGQEGARLVKDGSFAARCADV